MLNIDSALLEKLMIITMWAEDKQLFEQTRNTFFIEINKLRKKLYQQNHIYEKFYKKTFLYEKYGEKWIQSFMDNPVFYYQEDLDEFIRWCILLIKKAEEDS